MRRLPPPGRRAAFVLLYQHGRPSTTPYEALFERYAADTGEPIPTYAREVIDGVTAALLGSWIGRLDAAATGGWTSDRLGAVERAVLGRGLGSSPPGRTSPVEVGLSTRPFEPAKRYATPEVGGVRQRRARPHRPGGGDGAVSEADEQRLRSLLTRLEASCADGSTRPAWTPTRRSPCWAR